MDMRTPASMSRRFARTAGPFVLAAGLLALALFGGKLPTVFAQLTGQNKPDGRDEGTKTISVQVRLVVEAVTVKDKNGKPIDGLGAKDFTITEDGVAQKISFCEHQNLPETAAPLPPPTDEARAQDLQPAGAHPGRARDAPGRLSTRTTACWRSTSICRGCRPTDQQRALAAAEKFVRKDMTEADLLAIMRYNAGSMDVLQDFTADRNRILSILETMVVGEGQGNDESTSDDSSSDTGAAFGQDDPRIQHLHHRPATGRAADGRRGALPAEREEGADLLFQRPEPERHRQPGATACDRGCGPPLGRGVLDGRRARPGGVRPAGQCDPGLAGRPVHVYRRRGNGADLAL